MNEKTIRRAALWGTIALWAALVATCANAHAVHPPPPLNPLKLLAILLYGLAALLPAAWVMLRVFDWVSATPDRQMSRAARVFCVLLALAACTHAVAAPKTIPECNWNNPGHRPYMGNVPGAVDTYTHIPADVRARLKARMQRHAYDDQITITRDRMVGQRGQYTNLRMMHFANGETCGTVSRAKWSDTHTERALIYTEGGFTIAVPSVCRNVSIIDPPATVAEAPATAPAAPGAPIAPEVAPTPMPPMAQAAEPAIPATTAAPESFAALAEPDAAIPGWGWLALAALGLLFGGAGGGHTSTTFLPQLPPAHVPGIPEPTTTALLVIGLAAVCWYAKRRLENRPPDSAWADTEPVDPQEILARAKRTDPSWSVLHTPGTYVGHVHHIAPKKGQA